MVEEEVIEEVIEEYVVKDEVLQHAHQNMLSSHLEQQLYVFKTEGTLFPGKVTSFTFSYYTLVVMSRSTQGGWEWPDKREIIKIKYDDVSTVDNSKISIKQPGLYTIINDNWSIWSREDKQFRLKILQNVKLKEFFKRF